MIHKPRRIIVTCGPRALLLLVAACLTVAGLIGSSMLVFIAAIIGNTLLIHRMSIWSTPRGAAAANRGPARFSLRGLFALTTLCAVLLGMAVSPLGEFMLPLLLLGPIVIMLCWLVTNFAWWAGHRMADEPRSPCRRDAAQSTRRT